MCADSTVDFTVDSLLKATAVYAAAWTLQDGRCTCLSRHLDTHQNRVNNHYRDCSALTRLKTHVPLYLRSPANAAPSPRVMVSGLLSSAFLMMTLASLLASLWLAAQPLNAPRSAALPRVRSAISTGHCHPRGPVLRCAMTHTCLRCKISVEQDLVAGTSGEACYVLEKLWRPMSKCAA